MKQQLQLFIRKAIPIPFRCSDSNIPRCHTTIEYTRIVMLLLVFYWVVPFNIMAQTNMISNGSFEQVNKICEDTSMGHEWFSRALSHWDGVSPAGATICDAQCETVQDKRREKICPRDVKPIHGNIMLQLSYMGGCMDSNHDKLGCSKYAGYLLPEPLELGRTYEISYWVYLKKPSNPNYTKHIGFNIYTDKILNQYNGMLNGSEFLLDTIIFDKWYEVKKNLRPLCDLKFIVFGTFRNSMGPETYIHTTESNVEDNSFFIDNVSLIDVTDAEVEKVEEVKRYCRYQEKEPEGVKTILSDINCYFESGAWDLNDSSRKVLDEFARAAKADPLATYRLSSHADNVGSDEDNMVLADKRMKTVQTYLYEKHKIPEFRFLTFNEGENAPSLSNDTEDGRAKNRRVGIKQTIYSLDALIYRKAIQDIHIKEDFDAALKKLTIWINLSTDFEKILMLEDPRLGSLRDDGRWKNFKMKVHGRFKNKESLSLYQLWASDQKYRTLSRYIENLQAYLHHIDSKDTIWDVDFPDLNSKEMAEEDQINFQRLEVHLKKYGFPRSSRISWSADKAPILIILHQNELEIMEKYLPEYEKLCRKGEADWKYYAFIIDRIRIMKGEPQKYGTQFGLPLREDQEIFPLVDKYEYSPKEKYQINTSRDIIGLPKLKF